MNKPNQKFGNCYFHDHPNQCCQFFPPQPVFYGMRQDKPGEGPRAVVMGHYAPNHSEGWCGQWSAEKRVLS